MTTQLRHGRALAGACYGTCGLSLVDAFLADTSFRLSDLERRYEADWAAVTNVDRDLLRGLRVCVEERVLIANSRSGWCSIAIVDFVEQGPPRIVRPCGSDRVWHYGRMTSLLRYDYPTWDQVRCPRVRLLPRLAGIPTVCVDGIVAHVWSPDRGETGFSTIGLAPSVNLDEGMRLGFPSDFRRGFVLRCRRAQDQREELWGPVTHLGEQGHASRLAIEHGPRPDPWAHVPEHFSSGVSPGTAVRSVWISSRQAGSRMGRGTDRLWADVLGNGSIARDNWEARIDLLSGQNQEAALRAAAIAADFSPGVDTPGEDPRPDLSSPAVQHTIEEALDIQSLAEMLDESDCEPEPEESAESGGERAIENGVDEPADIVEERQRIDDAIYNALASDESRAASDSINDYVRRMMRDHSHREILRRSYRQFGEMLARGVPETVLTGILDGLRTRTVETEWLNEVALSYAGTFLALNGVADAPQSWIAHIQGLAVACLLEAVGSRRGDGPELLATLALVARASLEDDRAALDVSVAATMGVPAEVLMTTLADEETQDTDAAAGDWATALTAALRDPATNPDSSAAVASPQCVYPEMPTTPIAAGETVSISSSLVSVETGPADLAVSVSELRLTQQLLGEVMEGLGIPRELFAGSPSAPASAPFVTVLSGPDRRSRAWLQGTGLLQRLGVDLNVLLDDLKDCHIAQPDAEDARAVALKEGCVKWAFGSQLKADAGDLVFTMSDLTLCANAGNPCGVQVLGPRQRGTEKGSTRVLPDVSGVVFGVDARGYPGVLLAPDLKYHGVCEKVHAAYWQYQKAACTSPSRRQPLVAVMNVSDRLVELEAANELPGRTLWDLDRYRTVLAPAPMASWGDGHRSTWWRSQWRTFFFASTPVERNSAFWDAVCPPRFHFHGNSVRRLVLGSLPSGSPRRRSVCLSPVSVEHLDLTEEWLNENRDWILQTSSPSQPFAGGWRDW